MQSDRLIHTWRRLPITHTCGGHPFSASSDMDSSFAAACIDGPGCSQLLAKTFDVYEAQRICCPQGSVS